MMNADEVIEVYADVVQITNKMLLAARNARWDDLVNLEQHCAQRIHELSYGEAPIQLPADLRNRKVDMLRKILADDREIRNLTEPWIKQVAQVMSSLTERNLNVAYGGIQAN